MSADEQVTGVCAVVEYDYVAKESDELNLTKGAIIQNIKQMPGGWWQGTLCSETGKPVTGMFPDNFVRIIEDDSPVVLRNGNVGSNRRCRVVYSYTQVNDDELTLGVGDIVEIIKEVEEGWWCGRLKDKVGVFPSNFVVPVEPSPVLASKRPTTNTATTAAIDATKDTTTIAQSSKIVQSQSSATMLTTTAAHSVTQKTNQITSETPPALPAKTSVQIKEATPSLPAKPKREYCRVEFSYEPQNEDELSLTTGEIIAIISRELPDKGWWSGESNGSTGVFPDNFVKLLQPDEVALLQEQQMPKSTTIVSANTTSSTTTLSSGQAVSTTTTIIAKSSQHGQNTASSETHQLLETKSSDSGFASRNIVSEHRVLEGKILDVDNIASTHASSTKNSTTISANVLYRTSVSSNNLTMLSSDNNGINSIRASALLSDEKRKTIDIHDQKPPVISKKPSIPTKSSTSAAAVSTATKPIAEKLNIKLPAVPQDSNVAVNSKKPNADSLPKVAAIADNAAAATSTDTLASKENEFDGVERTDMLQDVRACRVKAPRRRLPRALSGESNSSSGTATTPTTDNKESIASNTHADSTADVSEPQLVVPKPKPWQAMKAPWLNEMKESHVRRSFKSGVEDVKISSSVTHAMQSTAHASSSQSTKVQSQTISTVSTQQSSSSSVEIGHSTKVASFKSSQDSTQVKLQPAVDANKTSISARSKSPFRDATLSSSSNGSVGPSIKSTTQAVVVSKVEETSTTSEASETAILNSNQKTVCSSSTDEGKVLELEKRVQKLESVINAQQRTIESLQTELEKYTVQFVTRV